MSSYIVTFKTNSLSIDEACDAVFLLKKEIRKQLPELKFNVDIGIDLQTGKYTLELFWVKNPNINQVLRISSTYNGFVLNANSVRKLPTI